MNIPQEKIEQVRYANDIVDVVSGYVNLKRRGKNYLGLCPFHQEKTPSFNVNPEMQFFHCFGCGAGGNVFTFVMRIEGLTFVEAVKSLAKTAGITLPDETEDVTKFRDKEALYFANQLAAAFFLETLTHSPHAGLAREYLQRRGIEQNMFALYGLGYAPDSWDELLKEAQRKSLNPDVLLRAGLTVQKDGGGYYDRFRGRVTFAIVNLTRQVLGFGARRLSEDNSPKYINSPETDIYQKRFVLYGLNMARESIRSEGCVILVEGYTDFISMHHHGITNVVATSGTALTEDHARLLRRYTSNAVLLFDSDSAGAAAALRGADILLENGMEVRITQVPEGKDPDEFVRAAGREAVIQIIAKAIPLIQFKLDSLEEKGQLGTARQRADATKELLTSLSKVPDRIQLAFLIQDLSQRLGVEESILWGEMKGLSRQGIGISKSTPAMAKPESKDRFFDSKRGAAELGLVEAVFRDSYTIPFILTFYPPNELRHPEIRDFFQAVAELENPPLMFDPAFFMGRIQNPLIAKTVSSLLVRETDSSIVHKLCRDCIIALRVVDVDEEIASVRQQMSEQHNSEVVRQLMQYYKELVEQRKWLSSGKFLDQQPD